MAQVPRPHARGPWLAPEGADGLDLRAMRGSSRVRGNHGERAVVVRPTPNG